MTICLAYVRDKVSPPELILASDSQLNCGGDEKMLGCQKIFPLKRGDVALGFTGETALFFPILQQIITFCDEHKKNYSRATSLDKLSSVILDIANSMLPKINYPRRTKGANDENEKRICNILFFGWDNKRNVSIPVFKEYFIYSNKKKMFVRKKLKFISPKGKKISHKVYVIGDCVDAFMDKYEKEAKLYNLDNGKLDQEPLKIFQKVIDSNYPDLSSIGGTIQALKIYSYLNTLPYCIEKNADKYLYGRKLYSWENVDMESTFLSLP